jgi:hypothetical protein
LHLEALAIHFAMVDAILWEQGGLIAVSEPRRVWNIEVDLTTATVNPTERERSTCGNDLRRRAWLCMMGTL